MTGTDPIPMVSSVTCLRMRLEERLASILPDLLLDIDDISYIQHNDKRNSYLYTICAMLLDCQSNQIEIYCTPDGLDRKDSEEWNLLENSDSDEYKAGTYLCKCLSDVTVISLEKLSQCGSANSTPWTSTPTTPVQQSTNPTIQPAISSPSLGIEESPCSEAAPLNRKRKRMSVPSISNPDKFRNDVISRDRECIVLGTMPGCCVASHLIPVRVLQARFYNGGVKTGMHTFNDPYDPRVGVLLDSAIDRCVDQFWSAFIVSNDGTVTFHNFKTSTRPIDKYFASGARDAHGKKLDIIPLSSMKEVMNWHYKHTVVNCWGGFILRRYLQNFLEPEGELVADLLDEGEGYLTPPSSSGNGFSGWSC